jgi:hypothetical protein
VSIESHAAQDLAMSADDAEGIVGGKNESSGHQHKTAQPKPAQHAAVPAETDSVVQASAGGWQPVVDDPSEDC